MSSIFRINRVCIILKTKKYQILCQVEELLFIKLIECFTNIQKLHVFYICFYHLEQLCEYNFVKCFSKRRQKCNQNTMFSVWCLGGFCSFVFPLVLVLIAFFRLLVPDCSKIFPHCVFVYSKRGTNLY